jgi:hypothetical protein
MFTGGSASDALKFESTYVYANGKAYKNAALLAVFKTKNGVDFIKTQSVDVTKTELTITKADIAKRAILEFDGKPAVSRYAEALGVPREGIESQFFANPVGIVMGDDVFVRSCQRTEGETLFLYCNVLEDTTLNLLKIKDIIPDTKRRRSQKKRAEKNLGHLGFPLRPTHPSARQRKQNRRIRRNLQRHPNGRFFDIRRRISGAYQSNVNDVGV